MKINLNIRSVIDFTAVAITVTCGAMLVIHPEVYVKSSLEGIKLWALIVLPSLLPFFFLTALMSALGLIEFFSKICRKPASALFRCGGVSSYAFIMSILSGYPVGAKIINDLRKNGLISPDEATRMSTFCSTSGPLFIIGSVGTGMFADKRAGYALFISHILSAVICGLIFRFYGEKTPSFEGQTLNNKSVNVLYDCVYSSVVSVALVGGFICIFYVFADIVANLGILKPLEYLLDLVIKNSGISSAFCSGLVECTRGCLALSKCGLSPYSLAFAAANISFGGVSVIAQSVMFLSGAGVKTGIFISSKLLQTAFAFVICLCLSFLFF